MVVESNFLSVTDGQMFRYDAFISYRHAQVDRKWAIWLHRELESYRVPRSLVRDRRIPRKLERVFRDEEELSASSDLSDEIETALKESRYLIVVCSPRTPGSRWVNEEIVRFQQFGHSERILLLLVEGEPGQSFPKALAESSHIPLAADLRRRTDEPLRTLRRVAKLKLLAPLLGCDFDDLRQRHKERQTQRRIAAIALTTILLVLGSWVAVWTTNESRNRQLAEIEAGQQAAIATARQLANVANNVDPQRPQLRVLLASEAILTNARFGHAPAEAEEALRLALAGISGVAVREHQGEISAITFGPAGRWLATAGGGFANRDHNVYLWDMTASNPFARATHLGGHNASVNAMAFSPDGRRLATVEGDTFQDNPVALLWDLDSPTPRATELRGHKSRINVVAFSPNGRWLATAGGETLEKNSEIFIWDTDRPLANEARVISAHNGEIRLLRFISDDQLVSAASDDTARLWDIDESDPITARRVIASGGPRMTASKILASEGPRYAEAVSPDGAYLAIAGMFGARLWSLATAGEPTSLTHPIENESRTLLFSQDGQWLMTASSDGVSRRHIETGSTESLSERSATVMATTRDCRWLASAGGDNIVRLQQLPASGPALSDIELRGHEGDINALAFSNDARWLVSGGEDGILRIWDLQGPVLTTQTMSLRGHEHNVRSWFSDDGRWLATMSKEAIRVWRLQQADPTHAPLVFRIEDEEIRATIISPDGRWLAAASDRFVFSLNNVRVWDLEAPDPMASERVLVGHSEPVKSLAMHPSSRWLFSGAEDKTVRAWDLYEQDPSVTVSTLTGHKGSVDVLRVSSDGRWIVSASWDETLCLWLWPAAESNATHILHGHTSYVRTLAISPDSSTVASGCLDSLIKLWNLDARPPREATSISLPSQPVTLEISPDGRWLAALLMNRSIHLFDLRQRGTLGTGRRILQGNERDLCSIVFAPDSRWLVSGSEDGTLRIWRVFDQKSTEAAVLLRGFGVNSVSISPDGRWLATGNSSGSASLMPFRQDDLLDTAGSTVGRNLTEDEWEQYFPGQVYRQTFRYAPEHF